MNKVAIVTGASRGIGAATALELARRGYDLCINYIEQTARAEQTASAAREYGVRCITHQADVADAAAVRAMHRRCVEELGEVTLLVNNAGIARQQQFQDIDAGTWKRVFDVNLGGCFNCTQAVLPHMLHEHAGMKHLLYYLLSELLPVHLYLLYHKLLLIFPLQEIRRKNHQQLLYLLHCLPGKLLHLRQLEYIRYLQ